MPGYLMVYDTGKAINEVHSTRLNFPGPAWPVSAGAILRDSRGARGVSPTRAFPGIGSLAVFPPGGIPPLHRPGPFIAVAYPLLAHSRLGCSPECGLNAAYHTTSCAYRSNTNQRPGKKSGGFPAFRPSLPLSLFCSPVSAAPSPALETVAPRCPGIPYAHTFRQYSIQEKD